MPATECELEAQAWEAIEAVFVTGIPVANRKLRAARARAGRLRPKLYRWSSPT